MEFELILLIIIGLITGVINTFAGGGSLLTLPMLIFLGLPPSVANGTNRIAILIQSIVTNAGFRSKGVKSYPFRILFKKTIEQVMLCYSLKYFNFVFLNL